MKCIYCLSKGTEVKNSREAKGGVITWRRRHCPRCGKTFTTKESAFADNLFVLKRNGIRQRFMYEKLFVSLFTVLNNHKGGDHGDDAKLAKSIADQIIKKTLIKSPGRDTSTTELIHLAWTHLKKIDSAYADQYIYYSSHRRKIAFDLGLIQTSKF